MYAKNVYAGVCVSLCWGLPVAAATQEPHDLPGSLILPLCEQTTSIKHQRETSVLLFAEQQLNNGLNFCQQVQDIVI